MALWSTRVEIIGRANRSGGRSVVAAAAYRAGVRLHDERAQCTFDYSHRKDVEFEGIMPPDNAPEWVTDRAQFWNAVEATERRKDSQLARSVRLALPRELGREERLELLQGFVRGELNSRGMVVDVAMHCAPASDGQEQPHAHLLIAMRPVREDGQGFEGKTVGSRARQWNDHQLYDGMLAEWERRTNAALEAAGSASRVDRRTLAAQRQEAHELGDHARVRQLTREPEPYLGLSLRLKELSARLHERVGQWKATQFRNRVLGVLDGLKNELSPGLAAARTEAFAHQQARALGYATPEQGLSHER